MSDARDRKTHPENLSTLWLSFNFFMVGVLFAVLSYILFNVDWRWQAYITTFFSLGSFIIPLMIIFRRQCPKCSTSQPLSWENARLTLYSNDLLLKPYICPHCNHPFKKGERQPFNFDKQVSEGEVLQPGIHFDIDIARLPRRIAKVGTVIISIIAIGLFLAFAVINSDDLNWAAFIILAFLLFILLYLYLCSIWRDAKALWKRVLRTLVTLIYCGSYFAIGIYSWGQEDGNITNMAFFIGCVFLLFYFLHNIRPDKI